MALNLGCCSLSLLIAGAHSQKFGATPLSCWMIIEKSGEVCCAHCNCMAGLGEACSHIAAVLCYVEAAFRIKEKETCTQMKCEWVLPSYLKSVEYLPVCDIDFTSAKTKKRKLDCKIDDLECPKTSTDILKPKSTSEKLPTYDEMNIFYELLSKCGTKPAILSLIPDYSDDYVPKSSLPEFSQPLNLLYKPEYAEMDYHTLLNVCESVDTGINLVMAKNIERETRRQSRSKLWF